MVNFIDHEGVKRTGVVVSFAGSLITVNVPNTSRAGGAVLFYNIPALQAWQIWSRERRGGTDAF